MRPWRLPRWCGCRFHDWPRVLRWLRCFLLNRLLRRTRLCGRRRSWRRENRSFWGRLCLHVALLSPFLPAPGDKLRLIPAVSRIDASKLVRIEVLAGDRLVEFADDSGTIGLAGLLDTLAEALPELYQFFDRPYRGRWHSVHQNSPSVSTKKIPPLVYKVRSEKLYHVSNYLSNIGATLGERRKRAGGRRRGSGRIRLG